MPGTPMMDPFLKYEGSCIFSFLIIHLYCVWKKINWAYYIIKEVDWLLYCHFDNSFENNISDKNNSF